MHLPTNRDPPGAHTWAQDAGRGSQARTLDAALVLRKISVGLWSLFWHRTTVKLCFKELNSILKNVKLCL